MEVKSIKEDIASDEKRLEELSKDEVRVASDVTSCRSKLEEGTTALLFDELRPAMRSDP